MVRLDVEMFEELRAERAVTGTDFDDAKRSRHSRLFESALYLIGAIPETKRSRRRLDALVFFPRRATDKRIAREVFRDALLTVHLRPRLEPRVVPVIESV